MSSLKITILVDNEASGRLATEHGFAIWIKTSGRNILFDTGQGTTLPHNADILDVPLDETDILVLSHGHYDHTGGLPFVVEKAPSVHIYCRPTVKRQRFSIRNKRAKAIGMPDSASTVFDALSSKKVHWITQPCTIAPGIGLTGPVPRTTKYEDTGGPFYFDRKGAHIDPIDDDMALWFETPMGLVVIVGCGHAGLVNTLLHVRSLNKNAKIHAVIGGFHLLESSEKRVEHTIDALQAFDPELVVPCHCTGEVAIETLRKALGSRVSIGHAGATYEIETEHE